MTISCCWLGIKRKVLSYSSLKDYTIFLFKKLLFLSKQNSVVQKCYILKCIILFLNSNYLILGNHNNKKKKGLSVIIKTTFIGVDRTNVWSKTVYFPNPSHDAFLVPRCRRQFSWCCSPRPMSKRIWNSFVFIYYSTSVVFLCLGKGWAWLSKSMPTWLLFISSVLKKKKRRRKKNNKRDPNTFVIMTKRS